MISKELLSEILKEYKFPFSYEYNTYNDYTKKIYFYVNSELKIDFFLINIYELAHKCKVWALSKGYYFSIYSFNFSCNTEQEHRIRLLLGNEVVYWGNDSCNESEPEAIFKACEWILTKDSK